MTPLRRLLSVCLCVLALNGCETMTFVDAQSDQPWAGPGTRAVAVPFRQSVTWIDLYGELRWHSPAPGGSSLRASEVVRRSVAFLIEIDGWHSPLEGPIVDDGSSALPEGLIHSPEARIDRTGYSLVGRGTIWPRANFIVSVNPIVILLLERPVWTILLDPRGTFDESSPILLMPTMATEGEPVEVYLNFGFRYGTIIPSASRMWWYSPDLKQPPVEIDWIDSTYAIPVPWGHLLLERTDDQVVVTTE